MKKTQLLLLILGVALFLFAQNRYTSNVGKGSGMREKLIEYAETDKVNQFKTTLKNNPDSAVIYLNLMCCDLLQRAAAAGSLGVAKYLLFERKIDINCNEDSPLFYASSMGRSEMVRFLLQQGGQIRPNGYSQETSLHVAARTNPNKWVEREKYDFSKIDMLSVVKILVEHGADVNAADRYGETPLHKAAFVQNYNIVKFLLDQKANVNSKDVYGRTPLHQATFTNKDNQVCSLLLENGANVSFKSNNGQTPILWGHHSVDTSTIHLFVRYGYDPVRDVDNEGNTLLSKALARGQFATIDYLLDNKANVNTATIQGTTPLHIAARIRGDVGLNILKRLLNTGVDINSMDAIGHTPLFYIAHIIESDHGTYYPDTMIVNFLKQHGAHE